MAIEPTADVHLAASAYRELGLSVIPIRPGTKTPACATWKPFQKRLARESEVAAWFMNARHDIGIVMGEVSGNIVCRDFDDMDSYHRWANAYPALAADCPTVATGRPGRHVYFRADVPAICNRLGATILACGDGELRAGGYCVAPPSQFKGLPGRYAWLSPLQQGLPMIDPFAVGLANGSRINTDDGENTDHSRHVLTFSESSAPSVLTPEELVDAAIRRCLPNKVGRRHRCLFNLARELKAIPEYASADVRSLKPLVRQWHSAALPSIGTKPFEESWLDFHEAWSKVKYAAGTGLMNELMQRAVQADAPPEAAGIDHPPIRLLASLCRELQRRNSSQPFFLATRTAGQLLGVDHALAWRWLKVLVIESIIEVVEKGSRTKASTFWYRGTL